MKSIYQTTQEWAEQRQLLMSAFDEIGSTNDEAKTEAADLDEDPRLYIAAHQTNGRGRGKNTWVDTGAGENLLSSWSFHLDQAPQAVTGPRVGDALYRAVHTVWPSQEWSVKPPNDLYLGGKKVAGLLVETVSQGPVHRLIIGLGMNVLNHPRAIANAAHFDLSVSESEWYRFLDVLLNQFKIALAEVIQAQLSADVRASLLRAINACPVKKEPYVEVAVNGDLVTKSGKIPWTNQ